MQQHNLARGVIVKLLASYLMGVSRRPFWYLSLLILLSILAACQLSELNIDVSQDGMRVIGDKNLEVQDKLREVFGDKDVIVILFKDSDLFNSTNLKLIHDSIIRLVEIDTIDYSQSLFNTPNHKVIDGYIHTDPYLESSHLDMVDIEILLREVKDNPFVSNRLVSIDGSTLAIYLVIKNITYDKRSLFNNIESVISPLRPSFDEVVQISLTAAGIELHDLIFKDLYTLIPVTLVILYLVLLSCCRNFLLAFLPLLTAALSILMLLGVISFLGMSINILTALIPALLVIIGSTEDIHLITEYRTALNSSKSKSKAIYRLLTRMLFITAMTALTSIIGAASISSTPITVMRDFGILSALGLGLNYIITLLLVPIYLQYLDSDSLITKPKYDKLKTGYRFRNYVELLLRHKHKVYLTSFILVISSAVFISDLHVGNSPYNYLPVDSVTGNAFRTMESKLSGTSQLMFVLETDIDNGFKRPKYLREIHRIQEQLGKTGLFQNNTSLYDIIASSYSLVNDSGSKEIPDQISIIEELLLFLKKDKISEYVDPNFKRTVIYVQHKTASNESMVSAIETLAQFFKEEVDTSLRMTVTGDSVLTMNAENQIAMGQIAALIITLTAVFIIVTAIFRDYKKGIIVCIVNTIPLFILFGVISIFGLRVDTSIAMAATIAYGISVDFTLHFFDRYMQNSIHNPFASAIVILSRTIQDEFQATFTTTVTLTAGMCCLMLSVFPSVAIFGILCILVLIVSFATNFLITPLLVLHTQSGFTQPSGDCHKAQPSLIQAYSFEASKNNHTSVNYHI